MEYYQSNSVTLCRVKWTHHAACIGYMRTVNMILVDQPEGKRLLRRPMYKRRENNSETDPKEIRWEGEDWIYLAQNRNMWRALVDTAMIFLIAQNTGKF